MLNEEFIVDSDAFITPYRTFYPLDLFPDFWSFIRREILSDNIKILDLVYVEIAPETDPLSDWLSAIKNLKKIDHRDSTIINNYSNILNYIQSCPFYKPAALHSWATGTVADPWIVATAISHSFTVITFEKPNAGLIKNQPSKDVKIPDICKQFNVKYESLFYMMRKLGFRNKVLG